MTSSITIKFGSVRPLAETRDESKQTLSELDQQGRDTYFYGDSIEKKRLRDYQEAEKSAKKARREQRIREH